MPQANRYFLPVPGLIWQLTHRCHKRDFLLCIDMNIARVGAVRRPGVRGLQWQFDRQYPWWPIHRSQKRAPQ